MRTVDIVVDGQPVAVELYEPAESTAQSVVLMVHGGPGGTIDGPANLFAEITPVINDHGFAVARFNLRGSGERPIVDPTRATVRSGAEDVDAVFAALQAEPYERVILYAESMGATMGLLASCSSRFAASVLLWPALNLFDTDLREFLTPEQLQNARASGSLAIGDLRVGADFLTDCLVYDAGAAVQQLAAPVLVVHGDADEEVPCTHGMRAAAILGPTSARLVVVPGANHGLKLSHERDLVIRETLTFLDALS